MTEQLNPLTRAREAIADIINDADLGVTMYPYLVPGTSGLSGFVHVAATRSLNTAQTSIEVDFRVVLWSPATNDIAAQRALDPLLIGDRSVRAILYAEPTLRGAVETSTVRTESETLDLTQWAATEGWSHQFDLAATIRNGAPNGPAS